jgi:hypothetical protein
MSVYATLSHAIAVSLLSFNCELYVLIHFG